MAVTCRRPRQLVEPGDSLDVVVEHIRRLFQQHGQGTLEAAAEIRHQGLHAHLRCAPAHRGDHLDEVAGTTVWEIVAVHRGDHHMAQPHQSHGLCQMIRLIWVKRLGAAMGHITETAAPRADVTHDQECGRALGKAFAQVGAARLLADRVQVVAAQQRLELHHFRVQRGAHPDP